MITKKDLNSFKTWFNNYVNSFKSDNPNYQQNIEIKIKHSKNVCNEILDIGKSINLNENDLYLAETLALFHDIGRFEQYDKYHTFSDKRSENHSIIGINVLRNSDILKNLRSSTSDMILRCILYHNRPELPSGETEKCLLFTKLLRDADKVDIFRVVTEYYTRKDKTRNSSIELELPDNPNISDKIYKNIIDKNVIMMEDVENLNDFKLLQLGWIFDINFSRTYEIINHREYLPIIISSLPKSGKIVHINTIINNYISYKTK
ncbi:MAG: HD domain-containing protein [Bacteroidales bacterium]|nr:HD domain-containing protein [Bacteroidales bacterium]